MNDILIYTYSSVFLISLASLIGVFTLSLKKKFLAKIISLLVSFSAGALLGDAFIHLLPELIEESFTLTSSISIIIGMMLFFIMEKFIHWRHCHVPTSDHHPHPLAMMNLIGDSLHNFIDGMIIAASYLVSINVGIATTLAVIFHEIPQEIGDLGVFLHAGLSRKKALLYNFLSALSAFLGAIIVLSLKTSEFILEMLAPIAIGGFIYIAAADIIPELHKETDIKKSGLQIFGIFAGVFVMYLLLFLE